MLEYKFDIILKDGFASAEYDPRDYTHQTITLHAENDREAWNKGLRMAFDVARYYKKDLYRIEVIE